MSRFFATGTDSESESGEEEIQIPAQSRAAVYVSKILQFVICSFNIPLFLH